MQQSYIPFIFVASTVILLSGWSLGRFLTRGMSRQSKRWTWSALAILVVLQWVTPLWLRWGHPPAFVLWAGMLGMGLLAFLLVLGALGGLAIKAISKNTDPSRRAALQQTTSGTVAMGAVALAGIGLYAARRGPQIVTVPISKKNLHPDLDGFKIVQISDLHVGTTIRRGFVEDVVNLALSCKADCICLTGDIVDGTPESLAEDVEPLRRLRAPAGTFYVPGNHEVYWGLSPWLKSMSDLGFQVLGNRWTAIPWKQSSLVVMGVYDLHTRRFHPEKAADPVAAMKGAPTGDFRLMLSHQPGSMDANAAAGPFDLQLSGHTHGGQFFPISLITSLVHKYHRGFYRHGEHHSIYVNPATAYWGPPNRLGQRGEITQFVLTRG